MSLTKIRINFFKRVFLYSILIVLITISVSTIFNVFFLDKFYIYRKEQMMLKVVEDLKKYSKFKNNEELKDYIYQVKELEGIEITIVKPEHMDLMGRPLMIVGSNPPDKKFKFTKLEGIGALILSYHERLPGGNRIIVSTSLSVMEAHKHEINLFNILTAFVALAFSLIAGAFFSNRITADIRLLSKNAEEISKLKFPKIIKIDRNDEIGDLSRSLEKMSDELAASINSLRSFVSNASHELKTPISVLCTHAQALVVGQVKNESEKKRYYEIMLKRGLEMKEITQNLLTISKLDTPDYQIRKEKINLKSLVEESLEKYDFLEFEKDIDIVVNIETNEISGDPKLLKLATDNIIHNALKYSPNSGFVKIYEETGFLCIENQSEEVHPENIEKFFQPFYRGKNAEDSEIEGTGLGLSIVKKSLDLNGIPFQIICENGRFIFKIVCKTIIDSSK
ncbi:HAMP domain-containing sensor histidine kinase [uncultured Ilyobacter sp.]|uniref:sensor histidine kinase n=1 Tax=uncultured Ilyobacter sp. TaxID=544433 RepID=UPI0029C94C73|nr:HAMP domain-containing sensor histidine kinase [uncultured Ilyobacter sp.]